MAVTAIVIADRDNVATVLMKCVRGDEVQVYDTFGNLRGSVHAIEDIPFGHKVFLEDGQEGGEVHKYGFVIGILTDSVKRGAHIHVHNLRRSTMGAKYHG